MRLAANIVLVVLAFALATTERAPELAAAVIVDIGEVAGAVMAEWVTDALETPAPAAPGAPAK